MRVITKNPIIFDSYSNFNSSNTNEVKAFQVWSNSKGYSPKLNENGTYDYLTTMSYNSHGAEYETSKGLDFKFDVTQPKVETPIDKPLFQREPTKKVEQRVVDSIQKQTNVSVDNKNDSETTKKKETTKIILIAGVSAFLLLTVLYVSIKVKK
jgi:hypothetical protein